MCRNIAPDDPINQPRYALPRKQDMQGEVSRDIAMGLLFSGLVDDFRGDQVAKFCNEMTAYLLRKYTIEGKP